MKFAQITDITLQMLLFGGLYLPVVKTLIQRGYIIKIFRVLAVIPIIGGTIFSITFAAPLFTNSVSFQAKIFSTTAGVACFAILFKMLSFYYNFKNFVKLINLWDATWDDMMYSDIREEEIMKTKKRTDRWIMIYAVIITGSVGISCIPAYFKRVLEHPIIYTYSNASPEFDILATYELIVQCYLVFMVHAYNAFLMQNVAFERAYCEYLKKCLAIIIGALKVREDGEVVLTRYSDFQPRIEGGKFSPDKVKSYKEICLRVENDLRIWILQHQKFIEVHEEMRNVYNNTLCVEWTSFGLTICLVAFMAINNMIAPSMLFVNIMYSCNVYTIFYITCYYGDMTGLQSRSLYEDAFGEAWYLYPRKIRKALQFIIMRCKKPMHLTSFKILPLNCTTFAKTLIHSYSFFTFLAQIQKRNREQ